MTEIQKDSTKGAFIYEMTSLVAFSVRGSITNEQRIGTTTICHDHPITLMDFDVIIAFIRKVEKLPISTKVDIIAISPLAYHMSDQQVKH